MGLIVHVKGDLEVDSHHTVEDVGICLGRALNQSLGDFRGIRRYGHAVVPMDETLAAVTLDISNRPYLVFNVSPTLSSHPQFDVQLIKEFFQAFSLNAGITFHINVQYGENTHHIFEAIFKATGKALSEAVSLDDRIKGVLSTKGLL